MPIGMDDNGGVSEQYKNADNLNARIRLHRLYTVEDEPFYQFIRRHTALKAAENVLECGAGAAAPTLKFTLDSGHELLAKFFSSVEMHEHPSKPVITNARHAVEYMESSASFGAFSAESSEELFETINDRITADGAFEVTKRAGLFVCNK